MNTFFYTILFIIGILFGSFYTLAVFRIPKRQDITHTHSYCPNCNHKLGFFDLIPIASYLILKGKCRYCKQKIRPRYLLLEILSGVLFVAMGYCMNLKIETLTTFEIIQSCFIVLYLTFIVLIVGIDKENRKIDKLVSVYGIVISILYMVYLCIVEKTNIYRYGIYFLLYIIVLILDTITLKRYAKNSYATGIVLMIITMAIFTGEYVTQNVLIFTLLGIAIYMLIYQINQRRKRIKTEEKVAQKISIGFYLGILNILMFMFVLFVSHY